jgi:hypothetical protein
MSWFSNVLKFARDLFIQDGEDFIIDQLGPPGLPVEKDKDYVTIIIKSFRIVRVRRLTTKFYGCVHSRSHYLHGDRGQVEYQTVVVPAKLKELDASNLDTVIQIDKPVLGPVPYVGGLSLELGLFSVKSTDLAGPYIDLLTNLSKTAGVGFLTTALPFVEPLRTGADLLFGNKNQSQLEIGLDQSWSTVPTGYRVMIRAPKGQVNVSALKLDPADYKLVDAQGSPFKEYPYLVFEISSSRRRDDWMLIPELKKAWDAIGTAAKAGKQDDAEQLLKQFVLTSEWSSDLVPDDAKRLADLARAKLPSLQKTSVISAQKTDRHPLGELAELDLYGVR